MGPPVSETQRKHGRHAIGADSEDRSMVLIEEIENAQNNQQDKERS